jgi:DNA polymerase III epsilon subunit-like protein
MYVFFDTETGGLAPNYSLLTVSAIVVDPQLQIVPVLDFQPGMYLRLKYDNYVTNDRAMQVNKIDLSVHDQLGLTVAEASEALDAFLREAKKLLGVQRFIAAGHNVAFDTRFLQAYLLPEKRWDSFFKNPPLCTCATARFFNTANRLTVGCGLEKLCTHFGIDTGAAHNAENDNLASIELARRFVSLLPPL